MLGELAYGTTETYGFKEGGVALVKDAHYEEILPESIRTKLDELEQSDYRRRYRCKICL